MSKYIPTMRSEKKVVSINDNNIHTCMCEYDYNKPCDSNQSWQFYICIAANHPGKKAHTLMMHHEGMVSS